MKKEAVYAETDDPGSYRNAICHARSRFSYSSVKNAVATTNMLGIQPIEYNFVLLPPYLEIPHSQALIHSRLSI